VLVTIFTDASHCPNLKVGGWGMWAKSARGKVEFGGPLKKCLQNITEAELQAIVNGVYVALERGVALPGDTLLIQTDNIRALSILETGGINLKKVSTSEIQIVDVLKRILDETGCSAIYKHVKGHRDHMGGRFHCNGRADKWARLGLKEARETKIKQNRIKIIDKKSIIVPQ